MPNTPSLLEPSEYVQFKAMEKLNNEIRIATEVYLAERCVSIRYADLMDDVKEGLVSKNSLLNWLNDYKRKGYTPRKGIVSLYKTENPEHFINGKWDSRFFAKFVSFAVSKLIDKDYVNSKKLANDYVKSVRDQDWLAKATTVMGLKLLEELHKRNGLTSVVARTIIHNNLQARQMLDSIGAISGRVGKNNGFTRTDTSEIHAMVESYFKNAYRSTILTISHKEKELLDRYKHDIQASLTSAANQHIGGLLS